MAPERQVARDPVLERREPQFAQPRYLRLRERLVAHVLIRLPAPQPERTAKTRRGRLGLTPGQLRPAARHQQLKQLSVQLTRLDVESVPRTLPFDPSRSQPLTQPMHMHLQRVDRRRGWPLAPERVDQPVTRDDVAPSDQQVSEQHHLFP